MSVPRRLGLYLDGLYVRRLSPILEVTLVIATRLAVKHAIYFDSNFDVGPLLIGLPVLGIRLKIPLG